CLRWVFGLEFASSRFITSPALQPLPRRGTHPPHNAVPPKENRMALQPKVLAAAVLAALFVTPAHAQGVAPGERIEVTGTSFKRLDAETALPVQILRREDIERTGATTTEELLRQIPALTSFGAITVSQSNGTITTSQATVSLRALGSTRTLVLINGRRVSVFGGTAIVAVDVNSIPLAAIERIEVLKEGASSLYG